jgi:hypothetical protein
MSDLERRLSTLLHDAVDEPRRQLDPEDVFATRTRRVPAAAVAVLAAAVIAALAVALTLFDTTRHHSASPGPSHVTPQGPAVAAPANDHPNVLYGPTWIIDGIHKLPGALTTPADAPTRLVFTRPTTANGTSTITVGTCTDATARINADHISFVQNLITATQTNCGPTLSVTQSRFVYRVLHGTVTWSLIGHELTITRPGIGTINFTDTAPAGTVQMTLHLDATTTPANGQPIKGYITIFNETGRRILLRNTACDSWIGVGLTNAHVSYDLASGLVLCAGSYLPEGTSHTPISVQTQYQQCSENRVGQPGSPPCIGPDDNMPPLPAGRYQTKVEIQNITRTIPAPAPITIDLTKP